MKSGSTDENSAPIQHSSLLHQKLYENHAEFWTSFNTHCQVGSFLDSFLKKMHVFKNPIVFLSLKVLSSEMDPAETRPIRYRH